MNRQRPPKPSFLKQPLAFLGSFSLWRKIVLWLLVTVACWLVFVFYAASAGPASRLIIFISSLFAALLGGWRAGLAAGCGNICLFVLLDRLLGLPFDGHVLGYLIHLGTAGLLGRLRDLQKDLSSQLAVSERLAKKAHLRTEHLDRLVEVRTSQLRLTVSDLQSQISRADRAGHSLRQALETMDNLIRLLPETYFQADPQGRLTMVNDAALARFGYRAEDLKAGLHVLDMVVAGQREKAANYWRRTWAGQKVGLVEFMAVDKKGETFPAMLNAAQVRSNGQMAGVVGVVVDISALRSAERKLKIQEERLALALEATSDGLWDWDLVNDQVYFSPRYFTMLGYQPGELPHSYETWTGLLHPDDRAAVTRLVRRHIEGQNESFQVEFRQITKQGGWVWVLVRGKVVSRGPDGRPLRMVGTQVDLSERKKAEESLRQAHRQLEERVRERTEELRLANQALRQENLVRRRAEEEATRQKDRARLYLEVAGAILVALDRQGRVEMINRRGAQLLGLSEEEILGRDWFEVFLAPACRQEDRERFFRAMTGGYGGVSERENLVLDQRRRQRRIFWRTSLLLDERGNPRGMLGSGEDVTELRAAQERLKESRQYLQTVLATMQAGVLVIDPESHIIMDANSHALAMIGLASHEVLGRPCHQFVCPAQEGDCPITDQGQELDNSERCLLTADGREVPILKSASRVPGEEREYLLESFIDISKLTALLKEQEMDAALAKGVLNHTTGRPPRLVELGGGLELAASPVCLPCHQEGGDHHFLLTLAGSDGGGKTIFSLKDQSGHRVGCLLRSILTDSVHLELLRAHPEMGLAQTTGLLNRALGELGLFKPDDFVAAVLGELDHRSLVLGYLLAGMHGLFVIRGGRVIELPGPSGPGRNLPLGAFREAGFRAGSFQLAPGDRVLAYTDGLYDALAAGPGGEQGLVRALSELAGGQAGAHAAGLVEALLKRAGLAAGAAVDPRGQNQTQDDITILGLDLDREAWEGEETWRPSDAGELGGLIAAFVERQRPRWEKEGFDDPGRLAAALQEATRGAFDQGGGREFVARFRYGSHFVLNLACRGEAADALALPGPHPVVNSLAETGNRHLAISEAADWVYPSPTGKGLTMTFDRWLRFSGLA